MAERSWLAPAWVFGAVLMLIVATVLLSPHEEVEVMPSLRTRSATPSGARGMYEVLARLGWRVERNDERLRAVPQHDAVYFVLGPGIALTQRETHYLLEAVRRGAGLFVIPERGSPVADSLGVRQSTHSFGVRAGGPAEEATDTAGNPSATDTRGLADAAEELGVVRYYLEPLDTAIATRLPLPFPSETISFVTARLRDSTIVPVMLGIRLGAGRVVALADPYLLTNRFFRDGDAAVIAVRGIEWLAHDDHRRLIFDEYHNMAMRGAGTGLIQRALFQTPIGRTGVQLVIAAALLVVALGARPLPVRSRMRLERRSPFEHVGALARAYEQIAATRLASRRLVQGLRRRHPIGRVADEEAYLSMLRARYPDLADELDSVEHALTQAVTPEHFLEVGRAVETIERTIES